MSDILHRVGVASEPARVHEALTTAAGIRNWWSEETQGDAGAGGAFQFRHNRFAVLQADADLIRWQYSGPAEDWVGTEISFRLEWAEPQTYVIFKHHGWREANLFMHHCSTKWATFLLSLKDLIERGEGHPEPRDVKIAADA